MICVYYKIQQKGGGFNNCKVCCTRTARALKRQRQCQRLWWRFQPCACRQRNPHDSHFVHTTQYIHWTSQYLSGSQSGLLPVDGYKIARCIFLHFRDATKVLFMCIASSNHFTLCQEPGNHYECLPRKRSMCNSGVCKEHVDRHNRQHSHSTRFTYWWFRHHMH